MPALAAILAAVAAVPGSYAGTVSGVRAGFRVTTAHKVAALYNGRLLARCTDGRRRTVVMHALPGRWKVARHSGAYRSTVPVGSATRRGTLWFSARFTSARRSRVTLRHRFTYLPTRAVCDTGTRRFTATLRHKATPPWRVLGGHTADGSVLAVGLTTGGDAVRPSRMVAKMACRDGGSVTLDIRNPTGSNAPVTSSATFAGAWKFVPPAIPGRPAPSGGGVQLSGRVTSAGLEGAARMSIGFMDGSWCDSGWQMFSIAGNTAAG